MCPPPGLTACQLLPTLRIDPAAALPLFDEFNPRYEVLLK